MNNINTVLKQSHDIFFNLINTVGVYKLLSLCKSQYPKFIFSGVGKNWYICEKVVKTYISMGLDASALDCTHALHGDLGMLYGDDNKVLIFISKSGTTEEMIKTAKVVKELKDKDILHNITTVGFSLGYDNSYDNLFDILIRPTDQFDILEFDNRNLVPTMSINVMQMVLDYLGVVLFENDENRVKHYIYNHLGGHNGQLLGGDKIISKL